MIRFKKLNAEYQNAAVALLTKNKLPYEDFDLSKFHVIGAFDKDHLQGMAALEIYDTEALLRSVAIDTDLHKKGLGTQLIGEIIKESHKLNLSKLFILTETAEGFFNKLGFVPTDRNTVPSSIQQSPEFKHICPASAVCMSYKL